MHIILVSNRLTRARSVTLSTVHLIAGTLVLGVAVLALAGAAFYVSLRLAAEIKLPVLNSLVLSAQEEQARKSDNFLRENLNALAVKLGQM